MPRGRASPSSPPPGRGRRRRRRGAVAQFLEGDPITMTVEDVSPTAGTVPKARRIAVHMEAIGHCLLIRKELKYASEREGISGRVEIPADGVTLEVC